MAIDPLIVASIVGIVGGIIGGFLSAVIGWSKSETEKFNLRKCIHGIIRGALWGFGSALALTVFDVRNVLGLLYATVMAAIAGDVGTNAVVTVARRVNESRTA